MEMIPRKADKMDRNVQLLQSHPNAVWRDTGGRSLPLAKFVLKVHQGVKIKLRHGRQSQKLNYNAPREQAGRQLMEL